MHPTKEPSSCAVEFDATANAVNTVTVFQSDRAEVRRKITVALEDGQNNIEVKNLPTCLDENSIRVDGVGNATIFDVIYHPPSNSSQSSDATTELPKERERLNAEYNILLHQASILKDYSKTLKGSDTNTSDLGNFLDLYAARKSALDKRSSELVDEMKSVDARIIQTHKQLNADAESLRKRGVRITIVVLAQEPGEVELSLSYVVSNARWTPHYDLRATLAPSSDINKMDTKQKKDQKGASAAASSVHLHYRASITQQTGEDWNGVSLTLSTASPLQGTTLPRLLPVWIDEERERRTYASYEMCRTARSRSRSRSRSPPPIIVQSDRRRSRSRSRSYSPVRPQAVLACLPPPPVAYQSAVVNDNGRYSQPRAFAPNVARVPDTLAVEGAMSTTFSIPGLSNIPSDSDDSQQTHKVSIAELVFNSVEFDWVTVPKVIPSVFLQCKVRNTSNYVLLPGAANIFMNNNFIAKSSIPEFFSCSLGVDPALRVTYHPQSKKTRTSSRSIFSFAIPLGGSNDAPKKTTTTSFEQRVTIRNTCTQTVPRVRVHEQVPVSRDARIKVTVLEPRVLEQGEVVVIASGLKRTASRSASSSGLLGGPKEGLRVKDGVRVRWLPRAEEEGGNAGDAVTVEPDADTDADASSVASPRSESTITKTEARAKSTPIIEAHLDAESAQGLFEWVCELGAGASVDLVLAWEVSAPAGVEWTRQ